MGRLRGAPGIVNVLLGAQVLGALRCAFGRALKRDEATAKSPAPAYGACRWCLHAPYASNLLAHKGFADPYRGRCYALYASHIKDRSAPYALILSYT